MPREHSLWIVLALLWLVGLALRLTILAIPPVIPMMEAELKLSATTIGVLTTLPVALFGIPALLGSLLIARFGALHIVVTGLVAASLMSALRGVGGDSLLLLFAASAAMGAGIAIVHPAIPALVQQWLPSRVSFASAVYTNGLLVGEVLPVAFTLPFVLPLLGASWRAGLVFWSVPLLAIALIAAWLAPRSKEVVRESTSVARLSWWPNWGDIQIWQVALVFGAVTSSYFGANAFLPVHLAAADKPELISASLTALNLCQLPASFVMLAIASRIERRPMPFIATGALMLLSIVGIACTASGWTIFFAGVLGFLIAVVFTLGLALPPLLCAPSGIARMSAAVFAVSYTEALLISIVSGLTADWSGNASSAFIPIAASVLPLVLLPLAIRFDQRSPAPTNGENNSS